MAPRIRNVFLALGLAALVLGCGHSSNVSKEADRSITNARMSDNPVHTIVMPHDEPVFPPGAGRDEFVTACVVCHSPRYITMQPQFSRTEWLGEVKKMKDVYGAHISDEQVLKITAYLASINGKPDAAEVPKGVTYGE